MPDDDLNYTLLGMLNLEMKGIAVSPGAYATSSTSPQDDTNDVAAGTDVSLFQGTFSPI